MFNVDTLLCISLIIVSHIPNHHMFCVYLLLITISFVDKETMHVWLMQNGVMQ